MTQLTQNQNPKKPKLTQKICIFEIGYFGLLISTKNTINLPIFELSFCGNFYDFSKICRIYNVSFSDNFAGFQSFIPKITNCSIFKSFLNIFEQR